MTTVNITVDNRITKVDSNLQNYLYGSLVERVQSGADRTPTDKLLGLWPEHAYTGYRRTAFWGDFRFRIYSGGVPGPEKIGAYNGHGVNVVLSRPWTNNDDLTLVSRLAEKYRGAEWNVGVFAGELGKTVDTVVDRVKQLVAGGVAMKRGHFKQAVELLLLSPSNFRSSGYFTRNKVRPMDRKLKLKNETFQSAWLEARYAWRPLAKDIYDLSEAIRLLDVPRKRSIRVRHHIKKTFSCVIGSSSKVAGEGRYAKQIKAFIVEKPFSWQQYLGLDNPEIVAWELLPFSFVADWLIPIGKYLEARQVMSKVEATYVLTTYDWHRARLIGNGAAKPPDNGVFYYDAVGSEDRVLVTRTLASSVATPLPVFRNPKGGDPSTRLVDALTLYSSVFGGGTSHNSRPSYF